MTASVERTPVLRVAFSKAWASPPESNRHQLTHAVDAGFRIAMCGVRTVVATGTWPDDPTLWDVPLGRCPTCARVVYGSSDRRA